MTRLQARLDALRGEILILTGDKLQGRKLVETALAGLTPLGVEDAAELARLRKLLTG